MLLSSISSSTLPEMQSSVGGDDGAEVEVGIVVADGRADGRSEEKNGAIGAGKIVGGVRVGKRERSDGRCAPTTPVCCSCSTNKKNAIRNTADQIMTPQSGPDHDGDVDEEQKQKVSFTRQRYLKEEQDV